MGLLALLLASLALVTANTIQWDIEKRDDPAPLHRRDAIVEADVLNLIQKGGYFTKAQVGDPSQKFTLVIDTGSSDTWLPYSGAALCQEKKQCNFGTYNPDGSKTYQNFVTGAFSATFVDGSSCEGDYFKDDFVLDGATLKNFVMGLATKTSLGFGIVGLGYAINEASTRTVDKRYANLPLAMQEAGLINSVAYSLWLNDLDASKGNILFGGVDTSKYVGDMIRIPLIKGPTSSYDHFRVALTSVTASSTTGTDSLTSAGFPVPVILDSGSTTCYLPNDLTQQIWAEVGAIYDPDTEYAMLPCSFANNQGNFSFGFAGDKGPRINVGMDELVITAPNTAGDVHFQGGPYDGQKRCAFGISNRTAGAGVWILGDTFLRSAYVAYDLVNNEIGLANTVFNSQKSHVVAFQSRGAPIPSATAVSNKGSGSATPSASPTPVPTGKLKAAKGFQDDGNDSGAVVKGVSAVLILLSTAAGVAFLL